MDIDLLPVLPLTPMSGKLAKTSFQAHNINAHQPVSEWKPDEPSTLEAAREIPFLLQCLSRALF